VEAARHLVDTEVAGAARTLEHEVGGAQSLYETIASCSCELPVLFAVVRWRFG
jgi:hypothetical protein